MVRLGAGDRLTTPLEYPVLMHAVGQGALAVEIRQGDVKTREALRKVSHWQTEWRVGAERGLLRELEGGCSVPVGVETTLTELAADDATPAHYPADTFPAPTSASPTLHFSGILPTTTPLPLDGQTPALQTRRVKLDLKACVTSTDGSRHVLYEPGPAVITSWREAERWGQECARQLRTLGASEILEVIETDRKAREASALAKAAVLQAQSA